MSGFSGIDGADPIAFVPAITAGGGGGFTNANGGTGSGTGTLTSSSGAYKKLWGKLYWLEVVVTINAVGNATGPLIASLPFTAARNCIIPGAIWSTVGMVQGLIDSGLSLASVAIYSPTAGSPIGAGNRITVSGLVWSS